MRGSKASADPTTAASWPSTGEKTPNLPWRWRAVTLESKARLKSIQRRPSRTNSSSRAGLAPALSLPDGRRTCWTLSWSANWFELSLDGQDQLPGGRPAAQEAVGLGGARQGQ